MRLNPIVLSFALASAASAADIRVFSQPTTADDGGVGLGWYSHSEPRSRNNYKHADDFVLGADAELSRVVWWGQSTRYREPDLTNFDSFQLEFFEAEPAGGGWVPGRLLASHTFTIDATDPVATGRQTPNGAFEYRHGADLPAPLALVGGERYMLAVSAGLVDTSFGADAWQWQDADLHDGWSGVYSWASDTWTPFDDSDSAFELFAVPAPATVAPLALLALRRRR